MSILNDFFSNFPDWVSPVSDMVFGGGILSIIVMYNLRKRDNKRLILQTLKDLFRHSWRNTVILESLKVMLDRPENQDKRPSELHIAKLKGLDYGSSALFAVSVFGSVTKYSYMHELQLKIRNFHVESDVAESYLKSDNYQKEYFEYYLDALIWKQSYLTSEIERITKTIYPREHIENMYEYMLKNKHADPKKITNKLFDHESLLVKDIQTELGSNESITLTKSCKKIFFVPISKTK